MPHELQSTYTKLNVSLWLVLWFTWWLLLVVVVVVVAVVVVVLDSEE